MSNKGVDQKPSETAFINALRRTLACREYDNEFSPIWQIGDLSWFVTWIVTRSRD